LPPSKSPSVVAEGAEGSGPALGRGPSETAISFETEPSRYRHWRLDIEGPVATLTLAVDPEGGLFEGYTLKLNSYDLGVDIELHDAVQRLRFEHPEVKAVVITGGLEKVFCAGANIGMLAGASHSHKVNFCKFTNETRCSIEEASEKSSQHYVAALNGTTSGGGYEVAMSAERILLVDDRATTVSLPEVPLLGVLPGTGGLTRLVDKRRVRRDRADVFATLAEGIGGTTAVDWGLVDELATPSEFAAATGRLAAEAAASSDRPDSAVGVELTPLGIDWFSDSIEGRFVSAVIDRGNRVVDIEIRGPRTAPPADTDELVGEGDTYWLLALARELDGLLLHLRFNEPDLGVFHLRSRGDRGLVLAHDRFLAENATNWLVRELVLYWGRTLKRLDLSSRTLFALVEPGSCFAGSLFEIVLASDRSYMLTGIFEDDADPLPPAVVVLDEMNLGTLPMGNGITRLQSHFCLDEAGVEAARGLLGVELDAEAADAAGLVTFTPDDLDWADEIRIATEERASYSPDALTGMEANHRFVGPETVETKVFGRLTAWQNWVFQRPNAVGPEGGLRSYGSGRRPSYDHRRV